MWRLTFALAFCGTLLAADSKQQVFDLFTKIAAELSADNPMVFLESVDHDMPHFEEFQADLMALTGQADVANSLDILSDTGDDTQRTEEFDWFMQIVSKSDSRQVEPRRAVVKFRLERRGKRWKIVAIEPLHFFAPPKAS